MASQHKLGILEPAAVTFKTCSSANRMFVSSTSGHHFTRGAHHVRHHERLHLQSLHLCQLQQLLLRERLIPEPRQPQAVIPKEPLRGRLRDRGICSPVSGTGRVDPSPRSG